MGLFLKQNEQRSELQSKIAADLSERLQSQTHEASNKTPQPAILDNQQKAGSFAWLWIVLVIVVVVGIIVVVR